MTIRVVIELTEIPFQAAAHLFTTLVAALTALRCVASLLAEKVKDFEPSSAAYWTPLFRNAYLKPMVPNARSGNVITMNTIHSVGPNSVMLVTPELRRRSRLVLRIFVHRNARMLPVRKPEQDL